MRSTEEQGSNSTRNHKKRTTCAVGDDISGDATPTMSTNCYGRGEYNGAITITNVTGGTGSYQYSVCALFSFLKIYFYNNNIFLLTLSFSHKDG
jgi:hypothetical protein